MRTRGTNAAAVLATIACLCFAVTACGDAWVVVVFDKPALWADDGPQTRTIAKLSGRGVHLGEVYMPFHSPRCFGECETVRTAGDATIICLALAAVLSLCAVFLLEARVVALSMIPIAPPSRLVLTSLCGGAGALAVLISSACFAFACDHAVDQFRQATSWIPAAGAWGGGSAWGPPKAFGPPGGLAHADDVVWARPGLHGIGAIVGLLCTAGFSILAILELRRMLALVEGTRVAFLPPTREDSLILGSGSVSTTAVAPRSGYSRI